MEKELKIYAPTNVVYSEPCWVGDKEFSTLGAFLYGIIRDMVERYPELPNDELKYFLPEFWPTNLVLTSNIRELRHILKLRTAPAALKEFRELALVMYEAVPEQFKYLFADCVHEEVKA